jgi:hypothetical protein
MGLLMLVLIPVGYAVNGFVLATLWNWFLATALHVPQLSIGQGMGIVTIAGLLASQSSYQRIWLEKRLGELDEDELKEVSFAATIWDMLYMPLLSLLIGWVVHLIIR